MFVFLFFVLQLLNANVETFETFVPNVETFVPNIETFVPNIETFVPNVETRDDLKENDSTIIENNKNKKMYKTIMRDSKQSEIYKISLDKNISLNQEDCYDKCEKSECIKMDAMKDVLKKCTQCNSQKNKCFNRSIIGGTCDDCIDNQTKMDCYDIQNFGCTNPYNINDRKGVEPYYIQVNNNNVNSPYDKKCVFCWNLLDSI
jgi:hypothetical protein